MKKYLRRIGALLLSFIMVLSICTAVFADETNPDSAKIIVNNAEGAELTYAQVIIPDQTAETGWNFVNDDVAKAYIGAFSASNAQDAIKKMIPKEDVNAEQLGKAQADAAGKVTFADMENPQTVDYAGVYLVKAKETGYTYNIMAAYVGFGEVVKEDKTVVYPVLQDEELDAKKTPISVTKTVDDSDNVTRTGAELTYTVTINVPFIEPTDTDKSFWAYDELTGAEYIDMDKATITLAGTDVTKQYKINQDVAYPNTKFSVDLSDLIDNANSNAGKEVVITYKVKVTSKTDTITNTAKAGHKDGDEYGSDTIDTYEGNITLTKKGEKDVTLANAKFEVRLAGEDGKSTGDALKFTRLKDGVYKYDPDGKEPKIVTKSDGTVKVCGLDVGTYWFKEVEAPKGYSVNTDDVSAELKITAEDGIADAVLTATTSMTDTKVKPLPSTGGTGTYIFTIVGVMIMAGVAGMFIVSRRKEHE